MLELGLLLLALQLVCLGCFAAWRPCQGPISREAEARSEALLRELLGADQYGRLIQCGYIEVRSPSDPRRIYCIPRYPGQVEVYEEGVPLMALCVQSLEPIPSGDVVLMHKLMIEGHEAEYLRIANRFGLTGRTLLRGCRLSIGWRAPGVLGDARWLDLR